MKHFLPKLLFVLFLVLGISSFVFLTNDNQKQGAKDQGNVRFNTEMDHGFSDREPRR